MSKPTGVERAINLTKWNKQTSWVQLLKKSGIKLWSQARKRNEEVQSSDN